MKYTMGEQENKILKLFLLSDSLWCCKTSSPSLFLSKPTCFFLLHEQTAYFCCRCCCFTFWSPTSFFQVRSLNFTPKSVFLNFLVANLLNLLKRFSEIAQHSKSKRLGLCDVFRPTTQILQIIPVSHSLGRKSLMLSIPWKCVVSWCEVVGLAFIMLEKTY